MDSAQLTLITKEGTKVQVHSDFRNISGLIQSMLEDNEDFHEDIPLPTISERFLRPIVAFSEHYDFKKQIDIMRPLRSNDLSKGVKDKWEADFIKEFSTEDTVELMHACNFLEHMSLFMFR